MILVPRTGIFRKSRTRIFNCVPLPSKQNPIGSGLSSLNSQTRTHSTVEDACCHYHAVVGLSYITHKKELS